MQQQQQPPQPPSKRPRLNAPAPVNYVAGLGRGATGFTTRSDIGPAREPNFGQAPEGYVAGSGRGATGFGPTGSVDPSAAPQVGQKRPQPVDMDDDKTDYSESVFDKWSGYNDISFNDPSLPYDQDDEEADKAFYKIDEHLDSRRKQRREDKMREQLEQYRATRPKIQQQFADLKKQLSDVSSDEWNDIPEIGDYTVKKRKSEIFTPTPDSLLERAIQENQRYSSIDPSKGGETPSSNSGLSTPGSSGTGGANLRAMGEARETVLNVRLKQASDSVSGQTNIDPHGYVTSLNNMKISTDAEIGDIKKARQLSKAVINTNPNHPPGWIAAARVEEIAGKMSAARNLIMKGCDNCPKSTDVWLEAARLHTPKVAKSILAQAVQNIPNSVKIWLQAVKLENDEKSQKRVLRKALEFIPNSVRLWKEAISREEEEDARVMLYRAVECIPQNVDLWLALARLEKYENAKKVLNAARNTIKTEPLIWIAAAELEEAQGNIENISKIIKKAISNLARHHVAVDRAQWLKYAEKAEKAEHVQTCQSIIQNTISMGLEEHDWQHVWLEDAEQCIQNGSISTARAIYAHALSVYPKDEDLWLRVAHLERTHGDRESLLSLLKRGVSACPKAETLWLMAAKEQWLSGDVDKARKTLESAFDENPSSEAIWLAAFKLEHQNQEYNRARILMQHAREQANTEKVWMKSAKLERELKARNNEKEILDEAIKRFPSFFKLWLMRAQWEEKCGSLDTARNIYARGVERCPKSIPLWRCAAALELRCDNAPKARALLERGRIKNPRSEELWLDAVRTELAGGNQKMAETYLAKAFQELPKSGMLWAQSIEMEPRAKRKAKSMQALRACDKDPFVCTAVARFFWDQGKPDRSREWFERSIKLNDKRGDSWAWFLLFEQKYGTEEQQSSVIERCKQAEPKYGDAWCSIAKDPDNSHLDTEAILHKVVDSLQQ
eukprot:gb/GECH01014821.1/.p1 GENE.gb/GECH01014821.1/~~gb/GECH01014821.1/.p1  ORF type:complete len:953 (+),score=335.53 gb/GECH01014821.1/:1-2859(+)